MRAPFTKEKGVFGSEDIHWSRFNRKTNGISPFVGAVFHSKGHMCCASADLPVGVCNCHLVFG